MWANLTNVLNKRSQKQTPSGGFSLYKVGKQGGLARAVGTPGRDLGDRKGIWGPEVVSGLLWLLLVWAHSVFGCSSPHGSLWPVLPRLE